MVVAFEDAFDANRTPSIPAGLKVTRMIGGLVEAGRTVMNPGVAAIEEVCHCILAMDIARHSAAGVVWGALR